ncbi:MAG: hypothetical protein QXY41_07035 [Thermoproteota archaeon]
MNITVKDTTIKINFLKRKIKIEEWIEVDDNVKICKEKTIRYGLFEFLKVLYLLLIKKAYYEYLFSTLFQVGKWVRR